TNHFISFFFGIIILKNNMITIDEREAIKFLKKLRDNGVKYLSVSLVRICANDQRIIEIIE
ncbi:MAG: hypothetical protein LBI03_03730, partial [Clostridiales bacterium]|nr:hypothetical protein [Clostridiales bacterium]